MSRTYRRRVIRLREHGEPFVQMMRERACKPGCGVCKSHKLLDKPKYRLIPEDLIA